MKELLYIELGYWKVGLLLSILISFQYIIFYNNEHFIFSFNLLLESEEDIVFELETKTDLYKLGKLPQTGN